MQISLKTYTLSQINGIISNKKLIQNAQGRSGIYIINFLKRLRQILILELQANYKNEKITPDKLKAGVKSSGLTVASFYQEWIETKKTFKPNTLKNQELFVILAV